MQEGVCAQHLHGLVPMTDTLLRGYDERIPKPKLFPSRVTAFTATCAQLYIYVCFCTHIPHIEEVCNRWEYSYAYFHNNTFLLSYKFHFKYIFFLPSHHQSVSTFPFALLKPTSSYFFLLPPALLPRQIQRREGGRKRERGREGNTARRLITGGARYITN